MSFNTITHPTTGVKYSIFSSPGRELLKSYLNTYKSGGSWRKRQPSYGSRQARPEPQPNRDNPWANFNEKMEAYNRRKGKRGF